MTDTGEFDLRTRHFGSVTASLSHDLGNVLATMQAAAGLIDDYVVGAAEGELIDVEHLKPVLGRIDRNVTRGFEFVRLLNWIAHSIDQSQRRPALDEVIEKAAASARYFARQQCVELEVAPGAPSGAVAICAIDLHILLFSCFRFAADHAANGASVTCEVENSGEGLDVVFTLSEARPDRQPAEELTAMAKAWGGRIEWGTTDAPSNRLVLRLPGPVGVDC